MQWTGYVAAALVFCTFYMRTMLPLRWTAIASNVAFLSYAIPLRLWPVAILHGFLLPLNILRLVQLNRVLRYVRAPPKKDIDVAHFMAQLTPRQHPPGTVLFRAGDPGDSAYYIASGEVDIPEARARLGAGQFFGEVGVFSTSRVRTGSAVCATAVTLYSITEHDLVVAFYKSPALAFALVRLLADRMGENAMRLESAPLKPEHSPADS